MRKPGAISRRQALAGMGGLAAASLGLGLGGQAMAAASTDGRAGRLLWRAPVPVGLNALVPADGVVAVAVSASLFAPQARTGVYAMDSTTGKLAWTSYDSGELVPFAAGRGLVYCAGPAGITALSAATGRTRWHHGVGALINASGTAAPGLYDSGTVYTTASPRPYTGKSYLIALDGATGRERWTARFPSPVTGFTVTGSVAYAGWGGTDLAALDAATGALRWKVKTGVAPSQLAATDGVVIAGGFASLNTVALDARTGRQLWQAQSLPVDGLAAADGVVYTLALSVQALDARTGKTLWTQDAPGALSIVLARDVLYADAYPSLLAFSAATGKQLWSLQQNPLAWGFTLPDPLYSATMTAGDGVLYTGAAANLGSSPGTVFAIAV